MKMLPLILFLIMGACNKAPAPTETVNLPEVDRPVVVNPEVVNVPTTGPDIQIGNFINHTAKEKERNIQAIERVKETVLGQCFQKGLLESELIQTNGKTNTEVLSMLLSAKLKVDLEMYRSWRNTVGYTYPDVMHIWCNRKFHDYMDPCDVGANLAHEILGHKLGFDHDQKATVNRPKSVPYKVGSLVEQCCQEKK